MHVLRHTGGVLAVTVALVGVAACGTEPQAADQLPTSTPTTETTASPGATEPPEEDSEESSDATTVTVTLADQQIELSQVEFTAGEYKFVVEQTGEEAHAFAISGPGVEEEIPEIEPGAGPEEVTVTLEAGSYRLWCPVSGHAEAGMDVTVEVK